MKRRDQNLALFRVEFGQLHYQKAEVLPEHWKALFRSFSEKVYAHLPAVQITAKCDNQRILVRPGSLSDRIE
jgi:hypothetical protein